MKFFKENYQVFCFNYNYVFIVTTNQVKAINIEEEEDTKYINFADGYSVYATINDDYIFLTRAESREEDGS